MGCWFGIFMAFLLAALCVLSYGIYFSVEYNFNPYLTLIPGGLAIAFAVTLGCIPFEEN